MRQVFVIRIHDGEELKTVLDALFSSGFVFNNERRLKTFKEFSDYYQTHRDNHWIGWSWITIGKDRECKMVLDAYTQRPYDTEQVMLEEMLKMSKEGTW